MNTAVLSLLIFLGLFILLRTCLFLVQVEGWSMYPAYHHGDRLLALRRWSSHSLHQGQVVVWNLPPELASSFTTETSKSFIKRIIGLPGEDITVSVVPLPKLVNGEILVDDAKQELKTWHIPEGHCFVKGDSPGFDSTVFGPLAIHCVRGVILAKLRRVYNAPRFHTLTDLPSPLEEVDNL